jgi:hypothetical protein
MKKRMEFVFVLIFVFSVAFSYAFTAVDNSANANAEPDLCCFMGVCPPGCTPGEEWGGPHPEWGYKFCGHWDSALVCEIFCECW